MASSEGSGWDPDRYLRFRAERFAPFEDLVKMIEIRPNLRVVDLGCGTGELTARLWALLPGSEVLGIDNSPEMLERAANLERDGLRFKRARIESIEGEWDLIFSHAVLHWVEDHERLVPRLLSLLRPGGQVAVQIPSNHRHFTQTVITEVVAREPFRSALAGWVRRSPVLSVERYAELLHEHGAHAIVVLEKVYGHVLPDAEAVAEWLAGTTLVPYLRRLPAGLRNAFLDAYRERLRQWRPGKNVFFPFRRILLTARRPGTS